MLYGLADDVRQQMNDVFRRHAGIERVTLFGSRATNTYRVGSDIDLALTGQLSFNALLMIADQLEELGTLYSFDVLDERRITNVALREHIHRYGKVIYDATQERT